MSVEDSNDPGLDGLIELPSIMDAPPPEMVPVFELDGEIFEIPKEPSAGLALQYLEIQTEQNPDAATYWMLRTLLGGEAYDVLKNHPQLKKEHLQSVIDILEKHLLGEQGKDAQTELEKRRAQYGGRRRPASKK